MKAIAILLLCVCVSLATGACPSDSDFKTHVYCGDYLVYNEHGGSLYEVTVAVYPIIKGSISLAFQQLTPYCLRQIHWHPNAEIAYVARGSARVGVVGPGGKNSSFFNVSTGDAWFFPAGFLQYFQAGPDGVDVLLWFNTDTIGTLTMPQALKRPPHDQIAMSFFINQTKEFFELWNPTDFGTACPSTQQTWTIPPDNSCNSSSPYKFRVNCSKASGTVRDVWGNQILEVVEEVFPILEESNVSFSYAVIKPQCQRVMHWHPIQAELALVIQGSATIGLIGFQNGKMPPEQSFFNVTVGDIWYFPVGYLQYITSLEPLGGKDFIAVLGFSSSSLQTITAAGGLEPISEEIQTLSLGLKGNAYKLVSETEEPFSCLRIKQQPKPLSGNDRNGMNIQ